MDKVESGTKTHLLTCGETNGSRSPYCTATCPNVACFDSIERRCENRSIFEKWFSVTMRRLRTRVDAFDMSDEASRFGTVDVYIARRRITEDAVDGLFDFIGVRLF